MKRQDEPIKALIELHRTLERQGPGDASFSRRILSGLPPLPSNPRIVDFGSGAGAGALLLAEWFGTPVTAVDISRAFLDELETRARSRRLDHLVKTVEGDFGNLDWPAASIDLLWSEGAAYHLTFEGALRTWRPLMAAGGVAAVSELNWFTSDITETPRDYWQRAYPSMCSESENADRAEAAGFEVLGIHRLPSQAWWDNYYGPLRERIKSLAPVADAAMQEVIRETEAEMEFFQRDSEACGYSFYVLRAV